MLPTFAFAYENVVDDARVLIKGNQFDKAYRLLKLAEFENVDSIEFNHQLSVAAIRSGHPGDALYALDRILSNEPDNVGAQLDVAIAYFHIGNLEFSKQELIRIQTRYANSAPKLVINTINRYLDKINQLTKKDTNSVVGTLSTGYNTNINVGYDGDSIFLPNLNTSAALPGSNQKIGDKFVDAQLIASDNYVIDKNTSASLVATLTDRRYKQNTEFNQSKIALQGEGKYTQGDQTYSYGLSGIQSFLDGSKNYRQISANIGLQYMSDNTQSVTAKLKQDRLRFDDESTTQNSNKNTFSIAYSSLIVNKTIATSITANYGETNMLEESSANGNMISKGIKASIKTQIANGILSATVNYQKDKYNNVNNIFSAKRIDEISNSSARYLKPITNNLTLEIGLEYRKQNSNIELYNNDRVIANIGIRRAF